MSDHRSETRMLKVALFGGILVLNSYLSKYLFSAKIDPIARDLSAFLGAAILSIPIFWETLTDLYKGRVQMNELVTLALFASFAMGEYRIAGVVAFFMLTTFTIEKQTASGAEAAIEAVVRLTPRSARRLRDGQEEIIDAWNDLKIKDCCRVRPGENFPADGKILLGYTTVNQASITGESLPVDKLPGQEVYAGTQNLTGLVDYEVTHIGMDSTLGKVKGLIADAEKSKLPLTKMIDRYIGYYTPVVLMIAALTWFLTRDMTRVITVLIMAVPDDLIVAGPSAVLAAISSAARLGILVKDVNHIELASQIKAVIFDKTGTLTEGTLEVARLQPAPGVELADLLLVAASVESHSNHPTAEALRKLTKEANLTLLENNDSQEFPGLGVKARLGEKECLAGREKWLESQGISLEPLRESLAQDECAEMSIICIACDNRIYGWIGLRDAIRPFSAETIQQLQELGIERCCMVTGDHERVAQRVAYKLGISEYKAGCLPEEKEQIVQDFKKDGKLVAVVGDGVNDAPALARGDIGIAMGTIGSDVAMQSASIALMSNDLRRIPFLIALSRKAKLVMKQNLGFGLVFIICGVYLAIIGVASPITAAFMHGISFLFVFFNSARLVRAGDAIQEARTSETGKPGKL